MFHEVHSSDKVGPFVVVTIVADIAAFLPAHLPVLNECAPQSGSACEIEGDYTRRMGVWNTPTAKFDFWIG